MTIKLSSPNNEFHSFIEDHLDLQVKISYTDHHDFLIRHGIQNCSRVLDVGTGNGTFVVRLAKDHPGINFVGIDKRSQCVERCRSLVTNNFEAIQVDMFHSNSSFDFSNFDGILMRYFFLHVDHAMKILALLKRVAKRPSTIWIIDLDWSQFHCEPRSEVFDKLTSLVKDFCSKISKETLGGQNVLPLLEKLDFRNIVVERTPFSTRTIPIEELVLYLRQETICYSRMSGRPANDSETTEILRFVDEEVSSGKFNISYGMILISAELSI
ncbi:MAG TPA: class I SAM-dependent methyltransferase [Bacteriovoracaceae bacterium]|nr:class I SAM-dependent methyltransferase [Bacteriovoracaceae bacterium]